MLLSLSFQKSWCLEANFIEIKKKCINLKNFKKKTGKNSRKPWNYGKIEYYYVRIMEKIIYA